MESIELEFKEEALLELAKGAIKRKTGARGLRSILENLLKDLMFEMPDLKDLKKVVINNDVVLKKTPPLLMFSNRDSSQKKIKINYNKS